MATKAAAAIETRRDETRRDGCTAGRQARRQAGRKEGSEGRGRHEGSAREGVGKKTRSGEGRQERGGDGTGWTDGEREREREVDGAMHRMDGMGWDGMEGWMDGWMGGWVNGWMDGWMDVGQVRSGLVWSGLIRQRGRKSKRANESQESNQAYSCGGL